tara:strand:- start:120 stop:575 length:456 start_codon:yes stop_codon:yes gene_type:complete
MKIVIQRVIESSVSIKDAEPICISEGLIIFVGFCKDDTDDDILWGIKKIINMKILRGKDGNYDLNTLEKKSEILVISQFTLLASIKKGNKPSWHRAADQRLARNLYDRFLNFLKQMYLAKNVKKGFFGKHMEINIINDGPITIILDSKNKI